MGRSGFLALVFCMVAAGCGAAAVPGDSGPDVSSDTVSIDVTPDAAPDSTVRDLAAADDGSGDAIMHDSLDDVADTGAADSGVVDAVADAVAEDDGGPDVTGDATSDSIDATIPADNGFDGDADVVAGNCPSFGVPLVLGTLDLAPLGEVSGLAASRSHTGILWAHNDSGAEPRIWAIQVPADGAGPDLALPVVEFTVNHEMAGWPDPVPEWTSTAVDWEDIAIGPFAGFAGDAIFIADTGDNSFESDKRRLSVRVYVMPEPAGIVAGDIADVRWFDITYDDGYHDSEAFFVDPLTGDMYLVEKQHHGGTAGVYRVAASVVAGQPSGTDVVAVRVATIDVELATGADMTPDGMTLAIRNYGGAPYGVANNGLMWTRPVGATVQEMLAGPGCPLPNFAEHELQGETLAFLPDGSGFFTAPERVLTPQNLSFWTVAP